MHRLMVILLLMLGGVLLGTACSDNQEPAQEAHSDHDADNHQSDHEDTDHADHNNSEASSMRAADSHTHGGATLGMALDGKTLTVELDTPLFNLLGFEHAAETAAQKEQAENAKALLSKGTSLFSFNSEAGCSPNTETISVDLGTDDDHDHKDVIVTYEYTCQRPDKLNGVSVDLFVHFQNLAELDLVFLGPNTQKQVELSANRTRVDFTR